MNLKQLEVFLAVAESGSFSKGAEATFITQSTVSQHISALENQIGVRLLDRTAKGAVLTEGGKVLFQHARKVVDQIRTARKAMRCFTQLEDTELIIGGSNIPADYIIPKLLPILMQRFPGLHLTLLQGDSKDIIEKLRREEIEIGIVGSWFPQTDVELSVAGSDAISLVVGAGHPWCTRESVAVSELLSESLVVREPGSGSGKAVLDALLTAGITPDRLKIVACLGSNEAIKQAVIAGLGISFVSELSVRKELERRELTLVRVEGLSLTRRFFLARRAGRELSPAARAFIKVIHEQQCPDHR